MLNGSSVAIPLSGPIGSCVRTMVLLLRCCWLESEETGTARPRLSRPWLAARRTRGPRLHGRKSSRVLPPSDGSPSATHFTVHPACKDAQLCTKEPNDEDQRSGYGESLGGRTRMCFPRSGLAAIWTACPRILGRKAAAFSHL